MLTPQEISDIKDTLQNLVTQDQVMRKNWFASGFSIEKSIPSLIRANEKKVGKMIVP